MRLSLPAKVLPSSYDLPSYRGRGRTTIISPTVVITGVLSVIYVLAYTYYHYVSARDPTSYFFDKSRAYSQKYSRLRIEQADNFVTRINAGAAAVKAADAPPRICVGVATVARRNQQYVSTTIGSLLEGLTESERQSMFLNVLVAHSDPAKHPSANDKWMNTLPDRVLHYDPDSPDYDQIVAWEEGGWYRNKTIYDYTYLLRDCYNTNSEYIAMIEDDTIAARGWYKQALQALDTVSKTMQIRAQTRWAYLRLFYVEDLLGWNSEEWPKYLFWSLVVWFVLSFGMLYAKKNFWRHVDNISYAAIAFVSGILIPLSIGLHFMAGRQTMWPIPAGVQEMNKYGCCSQALVFPRSVIPLILARSDLTTDWLVDMMIEQIADKEQLDRWAVVPALFQHIGTTSSKGYGFDTNARELWNFRFEDHPP
ncbi:hypothetical protein LTR64_007793 [Lithohypha guttulata]|uniref:uncharacterized protein n=1 Tax=Lithohypha guttulata TaxID=1690604 RepID=UPI002DDF52B3|nr:hypothetical protein LTR51_007305 [Lithohypha guttulata]